MAVQDAPTKHIPLPDEWETAWEQAARLLRQACHRAAQSQGYGEVAARIPANGPKGPGREIASFEETFV